MSLGLYLHIPYCFSKCRYCDFYSHPGERGVPDAYVDALLRELDRFAPERPLQPDTLYFGGGTPSLLRPEQVKRLIDAARPLPGAEITLEANPETVTPASLAGFREAGVNRISFGVQSARDSQLRTLGRPHTAKQARAALCAPMLTEPRSPWMPQGAPSSASGRMSICRAPTAGMSASGSRSPHSAA